MERTKPNRCFKEGDDAGNQWASPYDQDGNIAHPGTSITVNGLCKSTLEATGPNGQKEHNWYKKVRVNKVTQRIDQVSKGSTR